MLPSKQREMMTWIVGVFFTIVVILSATLLLPGHEIHLRGPASVKPELMKNPSKTDVLRGDSDEHLPLHGKPSGLVEIEIVAPGKGEVLPGTMVHLVATIEAQSAAADYKYVWILPKEGVTVSNTQSLEGDLGPVNEGQKTKLMLDVINEAKENKQIHLHVYRMVGGEAMGKMAQYNLRDQDALDTDLKSKADELKAAQDDTIGSQKIMQ